MTPPQSSSFRGSTKDTSSGRISFAVAHVDCDWFESERVCIERIWPRLSPGGVMIFDDYDAWDGCTKAVDLFLEEAGGEAEDTAPCPTSGRAGSIGRRHLGWRI